MSRRSIEEIRKEEIIQAFLKVISEKGLASASIREIANTVGCNHGILRHYFGSKEGLIKSTVDFLTDKYMSAFHEGISKYDSCIAQIEYLFQAYSFERFGIELTRSWIEIFVFSKTNPNISKVLHEFYRKIKDGFANIITKGIESGEFRSIDPDVAANMILGWFEGTLFLIVVDRDNTPYELMYRQFSEMLLKFLVKNKE